MTPAQQVEYLQGKFPKEYYLLGIMDMLNSLGFTYLEDHGAIDPAYLQFSEQHPGDEKYQFKPEGFCLLADGRVGFCDLWGGTWLAPEQYQTR